MLARTLSLATLFAGLASSAFAAPALRSEVTVIGPVVTIGDMFEDAGAAADRGLFRSPLPGTTGVVSLEQLSQAASAAGLAEYTAEGVVRVRVTRPATLVDADMLGVFITEDLRQRGITRDGVEVDLTFDTEPALAAEAVSRPVELMTLRYTPGNSGFAARFLIAGHEAPVDVTGRVQLMARVPHLAASLPAGTILTMDDIEMRPVPLSTADSGAPASLEQLLGRQLTRQSRAGMMLRAADVADPQVVDRNAVVTLLFDSGPMRLTARGQALTSAAVGQPVQVLNSASRKVVTGIAQPDGTVAVTSQLNIAGL